jgi:enamine deaminase RidA (YjgF/YER057c/UK114 family)
MSKQYLTPETLFPSNQYGYSQVVVSEPGQQIFIAGQTAWDKTGKVIGEGDLAAQAEATLANIDLALKAAGATRKDLAQLRVYIVNFSSDCLAQLMPVFQQFWGDLSPPAQTMLGVQSLALPEFLIEIDAVAVRG